MDWKIVTKVLTTLAVTGLTLANRKFNLGLSDVDIASIAGAGSAFVIGLALHKGNPNA